MDHGRLHRLIKLRENGILSVRKVQGLCEALHYLTGQFKVNIDTLD